MMPRDTSRTTKAVVAVIEFEGRCVAAATKKTVRSVTEMYGCQVFSLAPHPVSS